MLYTRKEINVSTSACKKPCTDRGIRSGIRTGLNILTGETGAGKSILLGSIQLILGGKTSRSMIRENASYALVELLFQVENTKARESLAALDIYPEDGQVLMSRKIMDGRSINKINGETSTVSQMKAAAACLLDIHGQHEHQSLLYGDRQLAILDVYGKEQILLPGRRSGKLIRSIGTMWIS